MGQRQAFLDRAVDNPARFEHLDPTPVEEALVPPRRENIRDVVAQYVHSMRPEVPLSEIDTDDFTDEDPEDAYLTEHQFLAMAEEDNYAEAQDREPETDDGPTPPTGELADPGEAAPASEAEPAEPAASEGPT